MDGVSTDDTVERIKHFGRITSAPISVYSEFDSGVYEAMNRGIRLSSGEWIYFLGSDDRLHDDLVLASVFHAASKYNVDLVYGDVELKSNHKRYCGEVTPANLLEKNICHQAIFYSRKVFSHFSGFNPDYKIWADWDLNIRIFQNPDLKSLWIDRVIATYNNTQGASMNIDVQFRKQLNQLKEPLI
jgi:glycosyltransferase involved in cell wall biosynthesis